MTIDKRPLQRLQKLTAPAKLDALSIKDGWNFGLGFMAAVFVFSFIIIPTIFCVLAFMVAIYAPQLLR